MKQKITETKIELKIPENLRESLIFETKRIYGDIEFNAALVRILEEWLKEVEAQPILQEELYEEPFADAHALPEDQKDFFEFAVPALETRVLDTDYQFDFLNWNGNSLEDIQRARAQVMTILEGSDLRKLGGLLARNILEVIENGNPGMNLYLKGEHYRGFRKGGEKE
ncbi:MAG: hypothetical protein QME47_00160 [Candidatus Thermoplasmatota archaeon]|nr:hypothetical protein [Candidatus Thermoplasmatota archaeon]